MAYLTYRKGNRPNKLTDEKKQQVIDMYLEREDLSQVAIARMLGIGATTVGCILKDYYLRMGRTKPDRSGLLKSKSLHATLARRPEIIKNRVYGEYSTRPPEKEDLRVIINHTLRSDLKVIKGCFYLKGNLTNLTGIMQEVNRRRNDRGQDQIIINPIWKV